LLVCRCSDSLALPGKNARACRAFFASLKGGGYCGFAWAETAFDDAITGRPLSWLSACLSWKSSADPNSTLGGVGSTVAFCGDLSPS